MLNFLRKLRRNEMKESRYLKYAAGEIILVVIGILIAFSINNWNQRQKDRTAQLELFESLKIDFEARLDELREIIEGRRTGIEAIHSLYNIINEETPLPEPNEINRLLAQNLIVYSFNDNFQMLNMLFNTGQINQIKNESLKRKLIQWPMLVEEMLEEQRQIIRLSTINFEDIYYKHISVNLVNQQFNFRNYNLKSNFSSKMKPDYRGLLDNMIFENLLANRESFLYINIIDGQSLIQLAEEIIEEFEKELTQ